jgi:mono/diheme cytochrome c family protein
MEKEMKKNLSVLVALLLAFGLTGKARVPAQSSSSGSVAPGRDAEPGAAHFERLCAGCHGSDGLALQGEAPPLAGSSWVAGPETRLIRIVMHGVRGPIQVGEEIHDREMPGFGPRLSDDEMASLLSFVRSRWGEPSAPITRETVRRVRAAAGRRTHYWTAEELLATP